VLISSFENRLLRMSECGPGWCPAEKRLIFLIFTTPGCRHIGLDSLFVGDFQ
jgi:hypothetical protein